MSRADIDRTIAPLSFGQASGDRWDLIDPAKIATTCSPRHVQSVLEDAAMTVHQLVAALRASLAALQEVAGQLSHVDLGAMETIRKASIVLTNARGGSTEPAEHVEMLSWLRPTYVPPPATADDVLLFWEDGAPPVFGGFDGIDWIGPEGEPVQKPAFWAVRPKGPFVFARPSDPA